MGLELVISWIWSNCITDLATIHSLLYLPNFSISLFLSAVAFQGYLQVQLLHDAMVYFLWVGYDQCDRR